MTKWFEYEEPERIKEVYSKYSIKSFFEWWSDNTQSWMEIRTINWEFAKKVGIRFGLPYSHTGVFVNNSDDLKTVIGYCRDKETIWFGVQPRKFGVSKWGSKCLSGGDNFVESIKFIFIDIDRNMKKASAKSEELKQCDIVADKILEQFGTQKWNKSYCKICSGNGVQLLIKLDLPIEMPQVEYQPSMDEHGKRIYMYLSNKDFDKAKKLIYETIGKSMIKFVKKFCIEQDLDNVSIDKAGFRPAQVGALPVSKNYKFGGYTWRGVVDLQTGNNEGLTDNIFELGDKVKGVVSPFSISVARINKVKRLKVGHLRDNSLIKFMLENELPSGARNNYLWFQIKCLLRDYKIDMASKEFRKLHADLQAKQGTLSLNLPEKRFKFEEDIVNKWCMDNSIPPVYNPIWPRRNIFLDNWRGDLNWESYKLCGKLELTENDEMEDMGVIKKKLVQGEHITNKEIIMAAVNSMIEKYGEVRTKYLFDYVFSRFFNYR